jgi:exopolyphosphatase/guanosine-5'-triphosphate,3'-diphosphate pyrophosphatase
MKLAVLDLGTNTFHLLIAEVKKDCTWSKVLNERITVKLGKGGIGSNIITKSSYTRGMKALERFNFEIRQHKIKKVFAFGTAALRNAQNGPDFVKEARRKYDITINLIDGIKEAEFICDGVRQAVKLGTERALIMDIGGGSVEFIIADQRKIFWKRSFKTGAALLQANFHISDPMTISERRNIEAFLVDEFVPLFDAVRKYNPVKLVGAAGSFETFSSMIAFRFKQKIISNSKLEKKLHWTDVRKIYQELIASTTEERKKMKGLVKMRVDMIVMASLLLHVVSSKTSLKNLIVSSYSLKEGALYQIINKNKF